MRSMYWSCVGCSVLWAVLHAATCSQGAEVRADDAPRQIDVFVGGDGGYHTYRIPAVVITRDKTLAAFCEGRKTSADDHGDVDLVLRRSTDGGATWEPMQLVYEEGGTAKITIGNPCPVVDAATGAIWLPFTRDNQRVLMIHSRDDGKTWSKPADITTDVKKPDWDWYATGPGHGIQLADGRLMIPSDCRDAGRSGGWDTRGRSLVFFSDDHGTTWKLGGVTATGMNECEVVQRADGSLLLSMRNYRGKNQRAFAVSSDSGQSWSEPKLHEQVYCPTCQSSIARYSLGPRNRILYSGPGGKGRNNMTVRLSYDGGATWPVAKTIHNGPSAYSDLVVFPDGSIGCLYERDDYRKITLAKFSLAWLTDGADVP